MSIARHHNEWLSLVPVSGPFLSMPVLMRVFPQGLGGHESEHFRTLRLAYEEWSERKNDPAIHKAWIKFVLGNTLELPDEVIDEGQAVMLQAPIPAHGETLRPDYIIKNPAGVENAGKPRLLVCTYPASQNLERPVVGCHWKASPDTRMMELLHRTNCRIGLVTNGEHWMLVDAPNGETTGYISWYANLWLDENITLRAFRSLLGVRRFFSVPDEDTLETMLSESAANQQEVTDQLGYQVRNAVEVLVESLDRADQDRGGKLLKDITEEELYEAALTVMMRLVFLFSAEERELLPLDDPLYNQNYAVSTLRAALRETADQQTEDVLERRRDAWSRLLSTFRSVHGGIQHERLTLPAYGGHLLDPDRFPFLEGRASGTAWRNTPATPLPVNNRTVLHLLEALQILQVKVPGGGHAEARLLSFRSLDIEQIGHVYEGLLDHTAKRARETVLGFVGGKDKEPEIPLSKLEELRTKGDKELIDFLKKETGRTANPLKNALIEPCAIEHANPCKVACGSDDLWRRVHPFARLVRTDTFGRPVIIREGSVFVTAGTDRRTSGTHYTPTSLTEPIVKHTLDPLCYNGPAEGKPESEWKLRSARELLDLRICDMACGSGAFLVQACRYLSELLVEAWEQAEKELPGEVRITPYGERSAGAPSDQPIPLDNEERLTYAYRLVAQRCLYGVDVNPLAVEMAKLSLWLLTLAKDKPFEFLDHAIRCGDSLVGLHDLEQLRHYSLKPDADDTVLFKGPLDDAVDEAINRRLKLENMPANTVEDVEAQEELLAEAEDKIARLRCAADLLVAAEFWRENAKDKLERLRHFANVSGHYVENGPTEEFEEKAATERRGQPMFHWPLDFPEVIVKRGGFDGFVGNPPFITGTSISTILGGTYKNHLKALWPHIQSRSDVCVLFMLRAASLLHPSATAGFLGTDTTSEGDSRTTGPAFLLQNGYRIYRAVKRQKWPGTANVRICQCYFVSGEWNGEFALDDNPVAGITSGFDVGDELPEPFTLPSAKALSFTGTKVYGDGFVLTLEEGVTIRDADSRNRTVVKPYMIGKELNSLACEPGRYVIDFTDMTKEQAERFSMPWAIICERVKEKRQSAPERKMREQWWTFQRPRRNLYDILSRTRLGWLIAATSDTVAFVAVPYSTQSPVIFSHALNILTLHGYGDFAVVQSTLHLSWARKYGSSMKGDMRYTTTDCFETFPFPKSVEPLEKIGEEYYGVRRQIAEKRTIGLTSLYELFHNEDEKSTDIEHLRRLHTILDEKVAHGYGWNSFPLNHGFHSTQFGVRYTISEPVRREVLQRLLELNHECYEEEVKQGLHEQKKRASGKRKKRTSTGSTLFD